MSKKQPFLIFLAKAVIATVVILTTVFTVVAFWTVIGFGGLVGFLASTSHDSTSPQKLLYGDEKKKNTFVSIPITGIILGNESDMSDPLGLAVGNVTFGYLVKKELMDLAKDNDVKGVILEINSPGGTIYGSNAIAEGVLYYKEKTKKPVLAFVSGLAASGAYWSAVSADTVIADVGSTVGSIGVISGPYKYYDGVVSEDGGAFVGGVVTQKGIESTYISAGKSKDMGNPYRRLTKDEIASIQAMVNTEYGHFVSYVAKQRNISPDSIKNDVGALLYDTETAKAKHLIDETGSREKAYEQLAKKANVGENDFQVIRRMTEKGLLRSLLSSMGSSKGVRATFCGIRNVHLVYYGDLGTLCQ